MTSERDNCGLSSLLPVSCRGRAEAFARNLQNRLSSLGTHNSSSEERSWLGPHEKPITLSQPILNLETDRFVELDSLQSPCSPQEELEENELHRLLNTVTLKPEINGDCRHPKINGEESKYHRTNGSYLHQSFDSDSEVFYDLDDDPPTQPYTNGLQNSEFSRSVDSETGIDVNSQATSSSNLSDTFATSLDCTPQPSVSDDHSTLSLGDDSSIVSSNVDIQEDSCEGCEKNREMKHRKTRKEETDSTNSENGESFLNGEVVDENNDSETYVSVLTVSSELVVECRIDPEENILEDIGSRESYENDNTNVNGENDDNDDDDDNDNFIPRVRRCSSLKTGKTPPGTPGRKKIVRFADVLGLDLADVRTFLDEVPKVPKSAYNDLSDVDLSDGSDLSAVVTSTKFHGIKTDRILISEFDQPAGLPTFLDLIRDNQVCLENALVDDPILFLIKGTVRVRNLDFHKSVHIRYTLDSWKTFSDVQAIYVENSCDGFSDRFSFKIYAHTLTVGQKLEFAVRFQTKGCQYWDSNSGRNYCFQCLPSAASSTAAPVTHHGLADWGASFY